MLAHHRRATGLSFVLALALLAAGSGRAAKPPNGFCAAAKGVAANIIDSTAIGNEGESAAQLKSFYEKIIAAEPKLLRTSPGATRTDLKAVFAYVRSSSPISRRRAGIRTCSRRHYPT